MKGLKITYSEIKSRQKADCQSHPVDPFRSRYLYTFYRKFSNPFTYIFVRLGISPNAITLAMYFLCIIGFSFMAIGTYWSLIIGTFFFILFYIWDSSDGEVARIQNSQSVEGIYFDRISHYVFALCIGFGLGIGFFMMHNNMIYILIGFVFALVLTLQQAVSDLLKEILSKKALHYSRGEKAVSHLNFQKRVTQIMKKGYNFNKANIFSKIFSIYPAQGLFYSDYFMLPILILFIVFDYALGSILNIAFVIYGIPIGFTSLYVLILSITKIIWTFRFLGSMDKNRFISESFE